MNENATTIVEFGASHDMFCVKIAQEDERGEISRTRSASAIGNVGRR
jgi:hypothetical protein